MAVLNLVKVQRKDPRLTIRAEFDPVSEEHAREVESVAQDCLDRIAETIQKHNQPSLPMDGGTPGKPVTTDGQGHVMTPSDRMDVKDAVTPMSEPLTQEHIEAEATAVAAE